jgi:hypothetical protein
VKPVTLASNLYEVRVMHEPVEERRNGWRVAKQFGPMCVTKGALNVK